MAKDQGDIKAVFVMQNLKFLLKAAGIHCYGVKGWAGGLHEWTAAILDGDSPSSFNNFMAR